MTSAKEVSMAIRIGELEARLAQVDRQSRCRHVWEPDEKTVSGRRCAECGCEPLKR